MESSTAAGLSVFLGLNLLAALSGAYFRPGAWYRTLVKPGWQPPDRLFGPVWAVLYLANAVAGWLVWQRAGLGPAMLVYLVSLALNAGWSAIFFGLRRIDGALLWIVLLWLSILAQILLFWPVSKLAAVLLLPDLAWVTFAAALNAVLWRLNPSSVGGR
jgi:benzodiazapine receptor